TPALRPTPCAMRRPSRSEGLHEAVEDQHAALSPHGEECAALRVRVSRLQGKRRRPAEVRSQMIARRARILSILTVGIFIVAATAFGQGRGRAQTPSKPFTRLPEGKPDICRATGRPPISSPPSISRLVRRNSTAFPAAKVS